MGLAFPITLGVAIAQPQRRVIALEGDGSLPMQFGCLAVRIDDSPGVGKPVRDPAQIRERFMRGIGVRA